MKQHWLDIQSFLADQKVLSAIDDLAIATKFEVAGINDTERQELAKIARVELADFLKNLAKLGVEADQGAIRGIDPRSKALIDAFRSARQDSVNFHSTLVRAGAEAVLGLLSAEDLRSRRELISSLGELRRIVERHQQTDVSAILEEI